MDKYTNDRSTLGARFKPSGKILQAVHANCRVYNFPFFPHFMLADIFIDHYLLIISKNTIPLLSEMAEIIGISSGLASLLALALESSRTLYSTVQSLNNREKAIRDLRDALRDLEEVLKILQDSIDTSPFLNSGMIERPLDRCRKACTDFNALIKKCSGHSADDHFSIRDWAKLRYMGEDVTGFQNMLSGYKSTITIALAYSNVYVDVILLDRPLMSLCETFLTSHSQLTRTTQSVINEYKELIENTKCDLGMHLQSIEDRLTSLSSASRTDGALDSIEVHGMKEELESTKHGLEVCEQFALYIEETRSTSLQRMAEASVTSGQRSPPEYNVPWLILSQALSSAEREIVSTRLRLLQFRRAQGSQPRFSQHRGLPAVNEYASERSAMKEEAENIKESLNFFDRVSEEAGDGRMNYFEDVSTGDKSKQVIVTTLKDLITARRITSGSGSLQVLGQLSEDSLNNVLRNQVTGAEASKY